MHVCWRKAKRRRSAQCGNISTVGQTTTVCKFLPDNLSYQCCKQQTFSVSLFSSRFSFYVTTLPVTNVKHGCFQTVCYGSFLPDNRNSVVLSGVKESYFSKNYFPKSNQMGTCNKETFLNIFKNSRSKLKLFSEKSPNFVSSDLFGLICFELSI